MVKSASSWFTSGQRKTAEKENCSRTGKKRRGMTETETEELRVPTAFLLVVSFAE